MKKVQDTIDIIAKFPHKAVCLILNLVVSGMYILGSQLDTNNAISWSLSTIFIVIFLALLFWPPSILFFYWIDNHKKQYKNYHLTTKSKAIIATVLSVATLIVYLASFPGIFGYDAIFHVRQFLPGGQVLNHYSILFSAIISAFFLLGQSLFSSSNIGVAVFTLLQSAFMVFVLCRVIFFIFERTKSKTLGILTTALFTINIFIHIMSVSICQDTLFAGTFALIFIHLITISDTPNEYFAQKRNLLVLPALILLLCLLRNNGIYIILFTAILGTIILKQLRGRFLLITIIPSILFLIFNSILVPALGMSTPNNTFKEMSSVPSQQFARVYTRHKEKYTDADLKELKKYYNNIDKFTYYNELPMISDGIKAEMKEDAHKDVFGYVSFLINFGLKNTKDFVEAALLHNLTLWYPEKQLNDSRMYHPYIEYDNTSAEVAQIFNTVTIKRNSALPRQNQNLHSFVYQEGTNWQRIPILRTLLMPASYTLLVLALIAHIIISRKWKLMLPLTLIIGLYICLVLSPVIIFRYILPVVLCGPLIIMLLFARDNPRKK